MIYSRKCIGHYCQSIYNTENASKSLRKRRNLIINPIMKGLHDVDSEANYCSFFDDIDTFKNLDASSQRLACMVRLKKKEGKHSKGVHKVAYPPQYKGVFMDVVAAYDKLVSVE